MKSQQMGPFEVKFQKLDEDKIAFLRDRLTVSYCEICGEKANLKILENNVEVNNICCLKFAKVIGNALTIKNINHHVVQLRGRFLNDFCLLENFIDAIIEMHNSIFNVSPSQYFNREIKEINTRERKELFKLCLDKYGSNTNSNLDKVWIEFNSLFKVRNQLAHWSVDTTQDGVDLIMQHNKIRLVDRKQNKIVDFADFDFEKVGLVVEKIQSLVMETIKVFKYYQNLKKENGL